MRFIFYTTLILQLSLFGMGCRKDPPPVLSILCIMDGFGGGDCALPFEGAPIHEGCSIKDAAKPMEVYCPPSAMKNFWATSQPDEANFASWCYKTTPARANAALDRIKARVLTAQAETAHPAPEALWDQRGAHAE